MLFDGDNQETIHKSAQAWYELSDLWHSILSLVCYRYWGTRVMLTEAEWCNLHMLMFLRRLSALRLAARNKRNAELSVFLCRYRKMGDIIGSRFKSSPRIWCWKKKPYKNKTKSDTRQMLFLGHGIVLAYIVCRLLFRGYCNFSRRSWKKTTLLDVSLIFSVMILLFYEY